MIPPPTHSIRFGTTARSSAAVLSSTRLPSNLKPGISIGSDPVALILGDNLFYGHDLAALARRAAERRKGATVFAYRVHDPERYGVVEFGRNGRAVSIEEKPKNPKSHWAVTGLYFYDNEVVKIAQGLKPSARGELEITDINKIYLEKGRLKVRPFGRGVAWLDTGTFDSLISSSLFVQTIEQRTGLMVGCPEEIAFHKGFIGREGLQAAADRHSKSEYGRYLQNLLADAEGRP
jgi:glucose-1-phosphate thymidylyltransferase